MLFFLGSQSRCGDCVFQRRFCNGEGRGAELIRKDARRVRWVRPGARIRRSSASFRMCIYIYNYNYIYIYIHRSLFSRGSASTEALCRCTWHGQASDSMNSNSTISGPQPYSYYFIPEFAKGFLFVQRKTAYERPSWRKALQIALNAWPVRGLVLRA